MEYGQVCLRRGEEKDLLRGKTMVFDNEIAWVDEYCTLGAVVNVTDHAGNFIARGFFNGDSKIVVRILTRQEETVDAGFFRKRLNNAWNYRRSLGFNNACRVVFGDSDGLPGLTVDKFDRYLSFQIVCAGMELWKTALIDLLVELFSPEGIYERNDLAVRQKEGLPLLTGPVYGHVPELVPFMEHEAKMLADLPHGQKTGHFLDQQENRGRIKPYCNNARVLDLCCHTGGFSIHAALYGASSVEAVDVSQEALDMAMKNALQNGVADRITPVCANVFDLVKSYDEQGRKFDFVICDPPAFTKSKKTLESAYRGYKELNLRCIRLVKPGGYLASWSCSQFMTPPLFLQMLREAAGDVGRPVRLLETMMQSRDHPADLAAENAWYLKGYILQVM
ncbi:MAG: class I SAM-dependent rRNA methyltransferase [Ruminococcaceae bacterium]|nr:class I SAM-dependent rRNA methyltransferase [Oscillospiraceae bacterium]